jgi:cytochrome P450
MDLLDPLLYRNQQIHQAFAQLPSVSWQERGFWAVLGYAEAQQVLTRPEVFSSAYGTGERSGWDQNPHPPGWNSLNLSDPPLHAEMRVAVQKWLRVRPHYTWEEEPWCALPRQTLQHLFRLNREQAQRLQDVSRQIAYAPHKSAWQRAEQQLQELLVELPCPLPLASTDEHFLKRLLVLSGLESSSAALASLSEYYQPGLDLQELLRLHPPIQRFGRRVMKEVELGGQRLAAGQRVVVFFAAANRDPKIFADPHTYQPGRSTPHLSFGAGPHRCPGRFLALAQMQYLVGHTQKPKEVARMDSSFCRGPRVS